MKPRPQLPPIDGQQRYSVPEALEYLRTSRKSFYQDVKAGRIRLIREPNRKRVYVHGSELIRASQPSAAA
jgi:hypothetical protein